MQNLSIMSSASTPTEIGSPPPSGREHDRHRCDREDFAANNDGYDEAIEWADTHTEAGDRSWVVEGSGSYGRGLTATLSRVGEWVIEFDRPHQRPTKDGAKTDELDAVRAAREALGRHRLHTPRTHDGHREALRVHTVTRAGVIRARTAAINELKALVLTSPDGLRSEFARSLHQGTHHTMRHVQDYVEAADR